MPFRCYPCPRTPVTHVPRTNTPSGPSVFGRLGESIEVGASARDLRSRMDPESASQVAIRRNQAKVIRARFCWVHLQDRRDEAEFMAGEM
jgi:hypothetical protein